MRNLVRRAGHRRHRVWRSRLVVMRALVPFVLLAATLVSVAVVVPGRSTASAAPQPYTGTCPGGIGSCVAVSIPCQSASCPTVVAGPTVNLVSDQFVYLAMSNFPAGDSIRVAYCTTDGLGTIVSDPQCATNTSGGIPLTKQFVLADSHGAAETTAAVAYDPSGQDNPALAAVPLVQNGDPAGSFYCDNGPDFCSLVVTDDGGVGAGPMNTTSNTVIIPLNFSPGSSACPTTDPTLYTDSSFTVEHLIPAVVQATCAQSGGVVALDTATNTASEINDLGAGGTPIAFTDDPSDLQLVNDLPRSTGFVYIPVALSATVVAFQASVSDLNDPLDTFPLAQYNMTPNMVAGVLTTSYAGGGVADSLVTSPSKKQAPPLVCADLTGCNKNTAASFNTFYLLNPEPAGVGQPGAIGSFFSNNVSGTNYQLSNWLCSAPNAPFSLSLQMVGQTQPQPVSVTDVYNPATTTITTPPTQSPFWNVTTPASDWPFKTCAPTSQFPSIDPGGLSQYNPSDTPALQATHIRSYGSGTNLGVGAMDWSEASFNGLNIASLQNASGNFVAPTATSVDAALQDATANVDGVLSFNYDNPANTAAYPMPMVTYAVVPTNPVPAAQALDVSAFLTNMVKVSSGQVGTLPGGYAPLPAALVTQAMSEISKDIVAEPSNTPTTTSTTSAAAVSSSSGNVADDSGSVNDTGGNNLGDAYNATPGATSSSSGTTPSTTSGATTPTPAVGGTSVATAGLDVLIAGTRYVLPVLIALALALVLFGPVLLALPPRRRRVNAAADSAEEGGGTS